MKKLNLENKGKIIETGDIFQTIPKKKHYLNKVYSQRSIEQLPIIVDFKQFEKAPLANQTTNKKVDSKKERFAGRPIFNDVKSNNHVQNVNAGRNRIFYSSRIF